MQKRMIGVICGAAVVVLLAGSVVLLTRPSGKERSEEHTSELRHASKSRMPSSA